ncbi:hypothetical protein DRW41_04535 [Neobacillus piezotolerans]|uniref:Uncharacterized protein n=1 Tax=Neobacillus piezotolerans TaxID=2259171 RepID=A0A3D8GX98_9BACI|nr:hypothetical protein [Neobacillus piezotolerans]RDU38829.1 hypothetical protein DRW41_04535 [Neobacillus piezotolerans]
MYFLKEINEDIRRAQIKISTYTAVRKLVLGALFAGIAAVLQSAGGVLPGVGYFISPFATAPILFGFTVSLWTGALSYFVACLLLLVLQPSELFVYPFTTGLLGAGLGIAFALCRRRLAIISIGAAFLTAGILILLYAFRFPVLGPLVSGSFSPAAAGGIMLFSLLYAWMWVESVIFFFKKTADIIP